MKKLTSIIVLLLCITNLSFAQNNFNIAKCEKMYHKNPQAMQIYNSDSLFLLGEYENSIELNLKVLNDTSLEDYNVYRGIYRLATCYSKLEKIDSAFYYLNLYVDNSCDDRIMLVDKNFDTLRTYVKQWNDLKQKIENGFVENIGIIKDTNLAIELFYLGTLDQKYRVYLHYLGQYSKEDEKNMLKMKNS